MTVGGDKWAAGQSRCEVSGVWVPKETWSVRDETMLAGSLRIAFQA